VKKVLIKIKKFFRQIRSARSIGKNTSLKKILDMGFLGIRHGFGPLEYYIYGFDKKSITKKEKLSYISNEKVMKRFRTGLNDKKWIPILENKLLFYLYYSQFNLPVVGLYGFYHPKKGFFFDGSPLNNKEDFEGWIKRSKVKNLVIKPVGSLGGKGILIIDVISSPNDLISNDGKTYNPGDIISFMDNDIETRQKKEDSYRGYVIEEKIEQDPIMNVFSSAALNTVRVSTLITKKNDILIDFSMLRVGKEGSLTDNLHQGGYVINVKIEDGSLDETTYGYIGKEGPWVEKKDTNIKKLFKNGRVPYWRDSIALAKRAALVSPELRTIGWDIAVSKRGLILMEGNDNWDVVIAQVLAGGYLTPERREVLKEYGMEFPA
jgi:hypothetical protein